MSALKATEEEGLVVLDDELGIEDLRGRGIFSH